MKTQEQYENEAKAKFTRLLNAAKKSIIIEDLDSYAPLPNHIYKKAIIGNITIVFGQATANNFVQEFKIYKTLKHKRIKYSSLKDYACHALCLPTEEIIKAWESCENEIGKLVFPNANYDIEPTI